MTRPSVDEVRQQVRVACDDYERFFPPPRALPPNLRLAVDALAAAEPEVVTDVAGLDALPVGSVVRNRFGCVAERQTRCEMGWRYTGDGNWFAIDPTQLPVTVLHRGEA